MRSQRRQSIVAGWSVEVSAQDHVTFGRNVLQMLNNFLNLFPMFDSLVSVVTRETGRPEIKSRHRRSKTSADNIDEDAAR